MTAAYRWNPTVAPAAELRRLGRVQVGRAIAELDIGDRNAAVHQIRKRCKKLRALVRLVRPVAGDLYKAENRRIRDLARRLSDVRDDVVARAAFETLVEEGGDTLDSENVAAVRDGLMSPDVTGQEREEALERARTDLTALLERIEAEWALPDDDPGPAAALDGFVHSYARGRDLFSDALDDPTTDALHEWRKRVKDHGYHCRLLRAVWAPVLKVRAAALSDLGDLLGDDHDLAVLRGRLEDRPDRSGGATPTAHISAVLDRRRARLQQEAVSLGRRLYADRPKALHRQLTRWWDATVADADVGAPVPLVRPGA